MANDVFIIERFVGTALAAVYAPWKVFMSIVDGPTIFGIIITLMMFRKMIFYLPSFLHKWVEELWFVNSLFHGE